MNRITPENQARLLDALAHPNRIRILEKVRDGYNCSCEIAPKLGLEQSNLSRHIKVLVESGILVPHRSGVRINYHVANDKIWDLLELSAKIADPDSHQPDKFSAVE